LINRELKVARILVTIPAVFLVVGPPVADLNESHLLNPQWIGHARLHTAWLISTNALVCLVALLILWRRKASPIVDSVRLGAGLVACVLGGFFVATATQSLYGGSLSDPGVAVGIAGFDANLVVFSLLLGMVGVAALLVRRAAR